MWCRECNEAFDDDISECPFCGGVLSEMPKMEWGMEAGLKETLASWPTREDGGPVKKALLTTVSSSAMEDEILCTMLASFDIPTLKELPGNGILWKTILGTGTRAVDIFVPETMLEEAAKLLQNTEDSDGKLS